jgi:hypothetical protein
MNPANTREAPEEKLSERLFRLEPRIRYVALNQKGAIKEMLQSPQHPSFNPPESDRIEDEGDQIKDRGNHTLSLRTTRSAIRSYDN